MSTGGETTRGSGAGEITRLLKEMRAGDPQAAEELLSHVYPQLRALAAAMMAHEAPGQTLQPTALVHEAWLRLGVGEGVPFPDRAYFFAAIGRGMRRILVEAARRRKRLKRGGGQQRVELDDLQLAAPMPDDELLALDEALDSLAQTDARAAEAVHLCYFAGLTQEQAAKALAVSISTVERRLAYARAWLFRAIHHEVLPPASHSAAGPPAA
jgi:RNA polymerase sigma factor (TIGR02999 family)